MFLGRDLSFCRTKVWLPNEEWPIPAITFVVEEFFNYRNSYGCTLLIFVFISVGYANINI